MECWQRDAIYMCIYQQQDHSHWQTIQISRQTCATDADEATLFLLYGSAPRLKQCRAQSGWQPDERIDHIDLLKRRL
jgi:hypothetical protein